MVCVLGLVLNLRLSAAIRDPAWARLAGAATIPVLVPTLYFTFSRGAILAAVIGVGLLVLLGPTRGMASGLIAAAPTGLYAAYVAYAADRHAKVTFTSAAARPQAHHLLTVVALCVATALLLRAPCIL